MKPAWLAYVAMVLSISAFVPQTWKVLSTRSTKALSTPMWVVEVLAFATWATYGGLLRNWPILITNAICGTLAAVVLITKLVVERGRGEEVDDRAQLHSEPGAGEPTTG